MKTIAVDIDEVLARHNTALAQFHNERYGTNHTENDYFTDHWSRVWGVTYEEAERRALEFHEAGAHALLESVSGALVALRQLKQRQYRLVAVTVRRRSTVESTKVWLNDNYPKIFDDVRFVHFWDEKDARTKADVCAELEADWLIDDSIKHVSQMAEMGRDGLLFGNYTWNQADVLPKGVQRMKDWPSVVEYFDAQH
jgi:uncharacterized HAD superfamily protein